MNKRIFLSFAIIGMQLLVAFSPAAYATCEVAFSHNEDLGRNDQLLQRNGFAIARRGPHYDEHLGNEFVEDMMSLPEDAHVVDAGAGMGYMLGDYAMIRRPPLRAQRLTAIGVKKPQGAVEQLPGRDFRYLDGSYIEDLSKEVIGPTDLIADLYGPFAYSAQPDQVLRKYLEVLNPGRSAYIAFQARMLTVDGVFDGLGNWLQSIEGAEIRWLRSGPPFYPVAVIRVRRTSGEIKVPSLFIERFIAGDFSSPLPIRRYHR